MDAQIHTLMCNERILEICCVSCNLIETSTYRCKIKRQKALMWPEIFDWVPSNLSERSNNNIAASFTICIFYERFKCCFGILLVEFRRCLIQRRRPKKYRKSAVSCNNSPSSYASLVLSQRLETASLGAALPCPRLQIGYNLQCIS